MQFKYDKLKVLKLGADILRGIQEMYEEEATLEQVLQRLDELNARLAELERRVSELEGGGSSMPQYPAAPRPAPNLTIVPAPPEVGKEELVAAIAQALDELGEGEVGTIRAHLAKKGMISVTRSDVNKALYNRKDLFQIDRQEGMKPIWKRV